MQLLLAPRTLGMGRRSSGTSAGERPGVPSATKTREWAGHPSGHRGSDHDAYAGSQATPGDPSQASTLSSVPESLHPEPVPGVLSFPPLLSPAPPAESPFQSPAPARWSAQSGVKGDRTTRAARAHTAPEDLLLQVISSIRLRHTVSMPTLTPSPQGMRGVLAAWLWLWLFTEAWNHHHRNGQGFQQGRVLAGSASSRVGSTSSFCSILPRITVVLFALPWQLASTSWPLQLVLDPQALTSYQQVRSSLHLLLVLEYAASMLCEEAMSRHASHPSSWRQQLPAISLSKCVFSLQTRSSKFEWSQLRKKLRPWKVWTFWVF